VKAFVTRAAASAAVAILLVGCGSGGGAALTADERTYADACTATLEKFGQKGKESLCECAARRVVPTLTPAELKAFNTPPELSGKIMTAENTAPHGFTPADYGSMMKKTSESKAEVERACGA
jgi:hypothetical protein